MSSILVVGYKKEMVKSFKSLMLTLQENRFLTSIFAYISIPTKEEA